MPRLVVYLVIPVLLIVSLLTGSVTSRSIRKPQQPQSSETSISSAFPIVRNVSFLNWIHHWRWIIVFVQPQAFDIENITAIVRDLSDAHPSEEVLWIDLISTEKQLEGKLADLGEIQLFPFGNVRISTRVCGSPTEPLTARYVRMGAFEDLHYYPEADNSTALRLRDSSADDALSGDTTVDLVDASRRGSVEVVSDLLKQGADPNIKSKYGESPLIEAAFWGHHCEIMRLLLDAGAEINQVSSTGWTALMATAYGNRYESFELLVDRGADINMRSQDGRTALILAVRQRHNSIVKRLLSVGADPNVIDGYGETPLGVAKEANDVDLVRVLEQAGAKTPTEK